MKKMFLLFRGFLLWLISYIINSTIRVEYIGREKVDQYEKDGTPFIFALFHHSYFYAFYSYRSKQLCTLIADNEDGETLANYAKLYGYRPIHIPADENSPKAARAAIQMVKALREHPKGVIAVDGPYGPPEIVKPGILLIAQKTGAKIIPVGLGPKAFVTFKKRWDKHRAPWFFTKLKILMGEPIEVPTDISKENYEKLRLQLENTIKALDKKALAAAKQ